MVQYVKVAFHARCLNCLESFTSADSTPEMADFGHREKGYRIQNIYLYIMNTTLRPATPTEDALCSFSCSPLEFGRTEQCDAYVE